jgi:hypothetical protein
MKRLLFLFTLVFISITIFAHAGSVQDAHKAVLGVVRGSEGFCSGSELFCTDFESAVSWDATTGSSDCDGYDADGDTAIPTPPTHLLGQKASECAETLQPLC